jgi:tripartite-type tricarboxylate transporter receptor subunit TctC
VRALATTALHKAEVLPDLPRMADTYPGFEVIGWQGVFAPPGTSAAEVKKLHDRIVEAMVLPEVKKRLTRQGFRLATSTPEQLAERIAAEVAHWRERIAATDIDVFGAGSGTAS